MIQHHPLPHQSEASYGASLLTDLFSIVPHRGHCDRKTRVRGRRTHVNDTRNTQTTVMDHHKDTAARLRLVEDRFLPLPLSKLTLKVPRCYWRSQSDLESVHPGEQG